VALLATLVLLLLHAWVYGFVTDDAFISFRYARNLASGHGLVFNPGFERVEGYTNFLWVVILAGLARVGARPEVTAHVLSIAATVGLWAVVAAYAFRTRPAGGAGWLALVPTLLLAATRSIAVWSTSGLETRLFELLVVAGTLRLLTETERRLEGGSPRPVAALLLALATLTRPDGLLIAAAVFGVAGATLLVRGRLRLRDAIPSAAVFLLLVGGHLLFRVSYYGAWVPNTYAAKVGGRTWWSMGGRYLTAFVLEYAAWLWLPLLAAAIAGHARRRTLFVPALFAAAVIPHALYIVSIGGDHFEYRPFDLYFPFAFLLLYDGSRPRGNARAASRRPRVVRSRPLRASSFRTRRTGNFPTS
jgi:hypothetical protein